MEGKKKKPNSFRQGPDFQAQVNHLVIKTGKVSFVAESLTDPLTTRVCSRFEGRSSYVFFLVHLTASSKLDKDDLRMAVIFLKILRNAGKQTRIVGRQALNGLDYHKDYASVGGGVLCCTESESITNKPPPSRSRSPEAPFTPD